jgi:hypothetical protein
LTKVGNEAKPLKSSERFVFLTNLEQMIQSTNSEVNSKPTMTEQRLTRELNNAHHCMVNNDVFYRIFLKILTSARLNYELPDDGQQTETCRGILV